MAQLAQLAQAEPTPQAGNPVRTASASLIISRRWAVLSTGVQGQLPPETISAPTLQSGTPADTLCILEEGTARQRQRTAIQEARLAREVVFSVKGSTLESVDLFKYLGQPISSVDNDWPALHHNLSKARKRWGMVSKVLVQEEATPKVSAMFYKAVVQSVLLYGCEMWTFTPAMLRVLEGFHHRVARRISGKTARRVNGRWVYPPIREALELAGLLPIDQYILVRQRTLVEKIATRPIYQLCREVERLSGSSSRTYWWEQEKIQQLLAEASSN